MKNLFKMLVLLALLAFNAQVKAQGSEYDIPISELPQNVEDVLKQYIEILRSASLDQAAIKFVAIAGGSLINSDGSDLSRGKKEFSLQKDYNDLKHYAYPIKITRVNKTESNGQGYGETAIKGTVYKIWIDKKSSDLGMPAPISIMVPVGHATIKTPKVVNIGSL
jgi:hypothetical protein